MDTASQLTANRFNFQRQPRGVGPEFWGYCCVYQVSLPQSKTSPGHGPSLRKGDSQLIRYTVYFLLPPAIPVK